MIKTNWTTQEKKFWWDLLLHEDSIYLTNWARQIKDGANTINKGCWLDGGMPCIADMLILAQEVLQESK